MIRNKLKMFLVLACMAFLFFSVYGQPFSLGRQPTLELPEEEKIIYVGKNSSGELFLGIRTGERFTPHGFLLKTIDGKILYQSPSDHRYSYSLISPDKRFILLEYEIEYQKNVDNVDKSGSVGKYILLSANGDLIYEERKLWEYEQDKSMGLSNQNFFIRLDSEVFIFQNDGTFIDKINLSKYKYSIVNRTMPGLINNMTANQIYFAINYADQGERNSRQSASRPTYKAELLTYDIIKRSLNLVSQFENDETIRSLAYYPKKAYLYVYLALHNQQGGIASTRLIKVKDTEREVLFELKNSRMEVLQNYLVFTRHNSFRVFDTKTEKFVFETSKLPKQKTIKNNTLYFVTATSESISPSYEKRRKPPVSQKRLTPELTLVYLQTGKKAKIELKSSSDQIIDFSYRLPELFIHSNNIYIPFYNQLFHVEHKVGER